MTYQAIHSIEARAAGDRPGGGDAPSAAAPMPLALGGRGRPDPPYAPRGR